MQKITGNGAVFLETDGYCKEYELAEEFINVEYDDLKIFYIWGHSYEFEDDRFLFCHMVCGFTAKKLRKNHCTVG